MPGSPAGTEDEGDDPTRVMPLSATRVHDVLAFEYHRYYPEMLDWVAAQVARLVQEKGVPPGEIVVLAPFLSDVLRFSLMNRLQRLEVPVRSHRPSRALRDEPATQCLLTLAALAHPQWGIAPNKVDFTQTLVQAIAGMDPVRAQLMAEIVYRVREGLPSLSSFDEINPRMHDRITYVLGGRYEGLRIWLRDYQRGPQAELDFFLGRLFGEILSQPGYGFHGNFDAGQVAANLVESVQKFRWAATDPGMPLSPTDQAVPSNTAAGEASTRIQSAAQPSPGAGSLGQEYLQMVQDGVIAAQYIHNWHSAYARPREAVLLAPAYTFLMSNRPVEVQFWLDVGAHGWFERLNQPLTHPYVLSRQWPLSRAWTDAEEFEADQDRLWRLVAGLIRRCRRQIYLGLSELGEQGYEHRGPLLRSIYHVLQRLPAE